jgi:hypothetical protein
MTGPLATAFGDHIVAAGQFIAAHLTKPCARVAAAWPCPVFPELTPNASRSGFALLCQPMALGID